MDEELEETLRAGLEAGLGGGGGPAREHETGLPTGGGDRAVTVEREEPVVGTGLLA